MTITYADLKLVIDLEKFVRLFEASLVFGETSLTMEREEIRE